MPSCASAAGLLLLTLSSTIAYNPAPFILSRRASHLYPPRHPPPLRQAHPSVPIRTVWSATTDVSEDEKLPSAVLPITLLVLAQTIGEGIALSSLPLHMRCLGASAVQTGLATSAFSTASLLFTPPCVSLSNRIGRFKVLRWSLLGASMAQVIIVCSNSPFGVISGRFLSGVFAASVPVAQAAVTDLVKPAQSALALSRVSAASQLGIVIGPAFGALMIAILTMMGVLDISGRHMRIVYACSASLSLAVLALQGVGSPKEAAAAEQPAAPKGGPNLQPPKRDAPISPSGRRLSDALPLSSKVTEVVQTLPMAKEVKTSNFFAQIALRFVAISLGWSLTLSMSTYCLFGAAFLGYAQTQLSLMFSAAAALTVLTQLYLFPKLIKRLGEHLVCAFGLTASALGLGAFSLITTQPLHSVIYLISRMGNALGDTATATLVARTSDGSEDRARNLGMIFSVRAGARVVTPLLSAWLFELSRRGQFAPGALPFVMASVLTVALIPAPLMIKSFELRGKSK